MMPRIRTIKPEFFADEKLAPLRPVDRLVFVGLIALADDAGRLVDNLKIIDAGIFPMTDDTAAESLAILEGLGRIACGKTASGQPVVQIVNWSRHQKVDHPNLRACLPEIESAGQPPEALANDSRICREALATDSRPARDSTYDLRPPTSDLRPSTKRAGKAARFVPPTLKEVDDYCLERQNNINAEEFVNHYEANGWIRGKTPVRDWRAAVRCWEQKPAAAPPRTSAAPTRRKVDVLSVIGGDE